MKTVDAILKEFPATKSKIGLRVNPLAGEGGIAALTTAGKGSKFGLIFCEETFDQFVNYYKEFPWLTGMHCHVGSQGCPMSMGVHGAKTIYNGAEKINQIQKGI